MRKGTLGEKLRSIVLATPFIAASACGGPGGPFGHGCPEVTSEVFALSAYDAGPSDAGPTCEAVCAQLARTLPDAGCSLTTLDGGEPGVSCDVLLLCEGRRPATLLAVAHARAAHPVGAFFAEAARLEAASVHAFRLLERELAAHGAPSSLVAAARLAARDEVRHTRATRQLAARYGTRASAPRFGPRLGPRSLEAVALENAVEGCARETYGAAVALWQARHAGDPVVARALCAISADETRHAELSWEIARWAEPQLSPEARGRIAAARAEAFLALDTGSDSIDEAVVSLAGFPSAASARALLAEVVAELS